MDSTGYITAQNRPVLLARFYNYDEKKWDTTDRSPEGQKIPEDVTAHRSLPLFGTMTWICC